MARPGSVVPYGSHGLQHATVPVAVAAVPTGVTPPAVVSTVGTTVGTHGGPTLALGDAAAVSARVRWSATGGFLGLLCYAASLGPSLLPRDAVTQGVVSGLAFVTGYGIGALLGWGVRAIGRLPAWSVFTRRTVAVGFVLALAGVVALTPGRMTPLDEQAAAVGTTSESVNPWLVLGVTVVVVVLLLALGRVLRGLARALARPWARLVRDPAVVPATLGWLTLAVLVAGLLAGAYALMLGLFTEIDRSTAGQTPPTSPLRSGGPGSYVPWDTLGAEGRAFVSGGPTREQIAGFSGSAEAPEPIRVFAGLDSAPDAASRAALVVQELQRTGAFDRAAVVLITTTGNGFVDPVAADALEYVASGDVASAAIQYSVLPSWLSFLVDQGASGEAGTALFDAVSQAVSALPAERRPALYVYGESLGAYGAQAPFTGLTPEQVASEVDGALFVGPPSASALRAAWVADADGGTAWQPVVGGGRTVVFAATAQAVPGDDPDWGPRRLLYLQNATDPVVWFDPELVGTAPGWLDQPRGPGVSEAMEWWPLVTVEQVAMDLPPAVSMPPGYGHSYGDSVPVGWVAVLQPDGWTPADTTRLVQLVG
ncbi:MAG: alpha/beta-hydrolase family protein [Candidatus Nanopelagicales bacterium]